MAIATPPRRTFRWGSPWLIAAVAVAVVIVGTVGIGYGTGFFGFANHPGPPVAASPTAAVSQSPTGTPHGSPTPTTNPTPTALSPAAVLVGFANGDGPNNTGYDVSIVGTDGNTIASAHAPLRAYIGLPVISGPAAIYMPLVSVAGSHVYYLSGDTEVRMLARDGSTQVVTTVAGSTTAHAGFAVSPDESRIAVGVLDYAASLAHPQQSIPVVTRLYVEDLRTHANHVDIFTSSALNVWPIAWHQGDLVLAVGSPYTQQGIVLNPYSAGVLHLVNPATADRLATIGSETCWPLGMLTAAGIACYTPPATAGALGTVAVRGWDGSVRSGSPIYDASDLVVASVASDGSKLAIMHGTSAIFVRTVAGNDQTTLPGGLYAIPCWIDSDHVMSGSWYDQSGLPAVVDLRTGSVVTTTGHGMCAGISPSDLN